MTKKVKELSAKQKELLKRLPYDEKTYREQSGLLPKSKIIGGPADVYSKMWHLPSLAVNETIESSSKKMAANIINDVAWAKVRVRIVPDMDPQETI